MTTEHQKWLDLTVEEALEPGLPICDSHHHFWDRPNDRYFLDQLLEDMSGGHNIVQTVFIECRECRSMYRKNGPEEMKPLGETEFVQGNRTLDVVYFRALWWDRDSGGTIG